MIDQVAILFTGVVAVWLSQDKQESRRKWAPIFGLAGEPFWFYSAWLADQWGILALSLVYSAGWARGIKTYWWKR